MTGADVVTGAAVVGVGAAGVGAGVGVGAVVVGGLVGAGPVATGELVVAGVGDEGAAVVGVGLVGAGAATGVVPAGGVGAPSIVAGLAGAVRSTPSDGVADDGVVVGRVVFGVSGFEGIEPRGSPGAPVGGVGPPIADGPATGDVVSEPSASVVDGASVSSGSTSRVVPSVVVVVDSDPESESESAEPIATVSVDASESAPSDDVFARS